MGTSFVPAPAELCFGGTDGSVRTFSFAIWILPSTPRPMLHLSNMHLAAFALIPVPVLRLAAI